jgi:uncharacterized membrane protein YqhA
MERAPFMHHWLGNPFVAALFTLALIAVYYIFISKVKHKEVVERNAWLRTLGVHDWIEGVLWGIFGVSLLIVFFIAAGMSNSYDNEMTKQVLHYTKRTIHLTFGIYAAFPIVVLLSEFYILLTTKGRVKAVLKQEGEVMKRETRAQYTHICKYDLGTGLARIEVMELMNAMELIEAKLEGITATKGNVHVFADALSKLDRLRRNDLYDWQQRFKYLLNYERDVHKFLAVAREDEYLSVREVVHTDILTAYERMQKIRKNKGA